MHNFPIFWLGGAPCSGKTTIAERLATKYALTLFRSDDFLDSHMRSATPSSQPVMAKIAQMNWDEIWMRPLDVLVADEFAYYREEFPLLLHELAALPPNRPVIAEGNAWLPELLIQHAVPPQQVIYLIPTAEFQFRQYSQRDFIHGILARCSDPDQAFANWMARDAAFAAKIRARALSAGFRIIDVNGISTFEENLLSVELAFHFHQ